MWDEYCLFFKPQFDVLFHFEYQVKPALCLFKICTLFGITTLLFYNLFYASNICLYFIYQHLLSANIFTLTTFIVVHNSCCVYSR